MAPAGCFFALAPGLLPGSPEVCRIHGPGGLFFWGLPAPLHARRAFLVPAGCFLRWRPASCPAVPDVPYDPGELFLRTLQRIVFPGQQERTK
jgi:hypothetical protein